MESSITNDNALINKLWKNEYGFTQRGISRSLAFIHIWRRVMAIPYTTWTATRNSQEVKAVSPVFHSKFIR
jgi:hypothetical protein